MKTTSKILTALLLFLTSAAAYAQDGTFDDLTLKDTGSVQLNMQADNDIANRFRFFSDTNSLDIDGPSFNCIMTFDHESPTGVMSIVESGAIGVHTFSPNAMMHLTASGFGSTVEQGNLPLIRGDVTVSGGPVDRTLIDLRNNGKAAISLLDTGSGATSGYNINVEQSGGNDRMRFEKTTGAIRASAAFFADGHVRYSVNAKPNFTVKPNGDLNIIGQAPGAVGTGSAPGGNVNIFGFIGDSTNPPSPGNLFVSGDARVNGLIFGTLSQGSDRNSKENIEPVDTRRVLNQVSRMPITTWNYKGDKNKAPHMGPMSQDFHNSFGLGDDRKRIYSIDQAGVALAAIQGLNDVVKAKGKEIDRLREKTEAQAELIDQLMQRLESLEASLPASQR